MDHNSAIRKSKENTEAQSKNPSAGTDFLKDLNFKAQEETGRTSKIKSRK